MVCRRTVKLIIYSGGVAIVNMERNRCRITLVKNCRMYINLRESEATLQKKLPS